MNKEVKRLVQQLTVIPGVTVTNGGKHLIVRKDDAYVSAIPHSPSDHRWLNNQLRDLKAKGITPGQKLDPVVRTLTGPTEADTRAAVLRIRSGPRGSAAEFARSLVELSETLDLRGYANFDSAESSMMSFVKGGGLSGEREPLVIEAVRLWERKQAVEKMVTNPEPVMDPYVYRPPAINLADVHAEGEVTIKISLDTLNELLGRIGVRLTLGGNE